MPTRSRLGSLCALMLLSVAGVPLASRADEPARPIASSTDWPRWRGPNADGVAESRNLPVKWGKTENVLWSAERPGYRTDSQLYYVGTPPKR